MSARRRSRIRFCWSGGKNRACGPAADDTDGSPELHPVRVGPGRGGRGAGQGADRVMGEEITPDLLPHHVRGLRPQDLPGSAEVGLELLVSGLNRPPLMPVKRKLSLASRQDLWRYWAWEHCCRRRGWFAGCGQRRQVSAVQPSAGNAVTPDPVIWAVLPPERRAAAVSLLAMLAVKAAARVAGGGRDEPGQVPAAGAAAAEDRSRAPGPGGDRVRAPVEQAAGA